MAGETELERMVIRLMGDGSSYTSMLRQAEVATAATAKVVEGTGRRIEGVRKNLEALGKTVQNAGKTLRSTGATMSAAVTLPTIALGTAAIMSFGNFDQAMTETFAKMGRQTPEVRSQMEDVAKSLSMGGEVAFNPTQLAKGYEELASAGLNAERSMAALPATAKFAQAGAFGMEVAVKNLTGAMASFGITSQTATPEKFANEMVHFSDVIVGVANETTTGVEQVARAMSADAAVAAKEYGMSIEMLGAVLGVYAQQNKDAEEAGNLAGRAFRLMTASFLKKKDVWQEYGIDMVDKSTGQWVNFADAMGMVEKSLVGMTGPQRAARLEAMGFETLAQKSILPLIGQSAELRRQAALYQKHGTTSEMAAIQMESFYNMLAPIKNGLQVVAIEMGQSLAPVILQMGDYLRTAIKSWRALSPEIKQVVAVVAACLAVVGPLLVMFGLMAGGLAILVKGFALMLVPLGMIVSPLGLVVSGVTALGAGLAYVMGFDIGALWSKGSSAMGRFFSSSQGFIANFRVNMGILFDWLGTQWSGVWGGIKTTIGSAIEWIGNMLTTFFPTLVGLWDDVGAGAASAWGGVLTTISNFFSFALGFVANFSENMGLLWEYLRTNWRTVLVDVMGFLGVFAQGLAANMMVAVRTLFRMWALFGGWIIGMFKRLFSFEVIDAVLTGLIAIGTKIREWASAAWATIKGIFTGKGSKALDDFMTKANKDIQTGQNNVNLVEGLSGILREEMKNIQNPVAGMDKSAFADMPKFNLAVEGVNLPQFVLDQAGQTGKQGLVGGMPAEGADFMANEGGPMVAAEMKSREQTGQMIAGEPRQQSKADKNTELLMAISTGITQLVTLMTTQVTKPGITLKTAELQK